MNKKIALISTGGTIASICDNNGEYESGKLAIKQILPANLLENIDIFELFFIDSCNMSDKHLIKLANTVKKLSKLYDAIIITHGTDSMEQSAFFIHLTHKKSVPVIFTGAMRSSNASDFDGIDNFKLAISACNQNGVYVAMNSEVIPATNAVKVDADSLIAFAATSDVNIPQGIFKIPNKIHTTQMFYAFAGDKCQKPNAEIIVYAGLGNGSIPDKAKKNLIRAACEGKVIIRSSVVRTAYVTPRSDDEKHGFIASGYLNPLKARIFAMLAGNDSKQYFKKYAYAI